MDTKDMLAAQIIRTLERNGAQYNKEAIRQGISDILQRYIVSRSYTVKRSDVKTMITRFITAKRIDGLTERTLKSYSERLSLFNSFINKSVNRITTDDLREYMTYLTNERRLARSTLITETNVLRSFFAWLHMEEVTKNNPCLKIKSPKIDKKGLRKALSQEELEKVRNACVSIREKAIIELLYSTGCRLSEAVSINIDEINYMERSISVIGKGNKRRTVYFSVKAKLFIEQYRANSQRCDNALFVSRNTPYKRISHRGLQRIINSIGRRAGINKTLHPHLLRHTFASHALNAGMDIIVIQQLLGHSDVGTTQIYAEINQNNVKQAYYRLNVQ